MPSADDERFGCLLFFQEVVDRSLQIEDRMEHARFQSPFGDRGQEPLDSVKRYDRIETVQKTALRNVPFVIDEVKQLTLIARLLRRHRLPPSPSSGNQDWYVDYRVIFRGTKTYDGIADEAKPSLETRVE